MIANVRLRSISLTMPTNKIIKDIHRESWLF
jgi:hypothetical protein